MAEEHKISPVDYGSFIVKHFEGKNLERDSNVINAMIELSKRGHFLTLEKLLKIVQFTCDDLGRALVEGVVSNCERVAKILLHHIEVCLESEPAEKRRTSLQDLGKYIVQAYFDSLNTGSQSYKSAILEVWGDRIVIGPIEG